jgi:hypothetical protein
MSRLHSRLLCCYRSMLRLYPPSFRQQYAAEMEDLFQQRLEEAEHRSPWPLLILLLRELRDLPASVFAAHARQLGQRQLQQVSQTRFADSEGQDQPADERPVPEPLGWRATGLAIVLGILILSALWSGRFDWLWPGSGLLFCLLLAVKQRWANRQLPVWSYPLCGLALYTLAIPFLLWHALAPWFLPLLVLLILTGWGYAFFTLLAQGKQISWLPWLVAMIIVLASVLMMALFSSPQGWPAWWTLMWMLQNALAMPVTSWLAFAAVPLALRSGLRAALLVLGLGFITWEGFSLDFTYALAGSAWANLMLLIWTLMLLVIAPLWVLRARSRLQQVLGLTIPLLLALVAIVPLEAMARAAPWLVTDIFELSRYLPDSGENSVGVGTRAARQLLPILRQNGIEAGALLINWLLIVLLYDRLGRVKRRPVGSASAVLKNP